MNEAKNKAPDFPSSDYIRNLENTLENLSYFERRVFLKKRVVKNYPRFFYRYISLDSADNNSINKLRDIIVESTLWLSSSDAFNDPFDTKAKVIINSSPDKLRGKIKQLLKTHKPELGGIRRNQEINRIMANQSELLKNINNSTEKSFKKIGTCCFTTNPRNLLMWSHYANQHKGIVLQFEVAKDISAFLKTVSVDYVKDYPIINWVNETEKEIRKGFLNKFEDWEYENEWRIVHVFGANTYIDFKPEALTGVVFGCKSDISVKEAVKQLLTTRSQKKMPAVNIYNAFMHESKYEVFIKGTSFDPPLAAPEA